ncbi:MAG: L-threonylcarbamoyladenylate synthase [Eubacteriales bacterium]|nr:L-threonylcarbamoyladenylate synthase [Eubacteriales bacterium]
METKLLKPNKESIELACKLLQDGEVVGVPTETVYGLAGDSRNGEAIKKIFKAKGRPADNPLIVHISNLDMLKGVVRYVSDDAKKLMDAFWPGPLTIIMPKGNEICNETCAGLDSVGVRMPSNPIAHEIIEKSKVPFSAPSANISGKPSPTNATDVFVDMNGRIPLIIDGGECDAGVESTVISTLTDTPIILRPGVITKEMIENVLGKKVEIAKAVTEGVKKDEKVLSPGMKYKHYAPNADVIILKGSLEKYSKYVNEHKEDGTFALCFDDEQQYLDVPAISYGHITSPKEQAHELFTALRELDKQNAKIVYARCPEMTGVSLAVYNRLIRSAGFKIIDLD